MSEHTQSRVLCIGECMAEHASLDRPGNFRLGLAGDTFDTSSAGDSFDAGYLASEGSDMPLDDRIRVAAALARQVIGGKGALVAIERAPLDALSRAEK